MTKIFNGTYTIESTRTGEHRTFQIRTQPEDAKFAPGARVLALLNGPDNEGSFKPFAFAKENGFVVWRKHQGTVMAKYAAMLGALLTKEESNTFANGYRITKACTCIRCNRKLTTPDSIKCGIGPLCAEKMGIDRTNLAAAFDAARLQAEQRATASETPAHVAQPTNYCGVPTAAPAIPRYERKSTAPWAR